MLHSASVRTLGVLALVLLHVLLSESWFAPSFTTVATLVAIQLLSLMNSFTNISPRKIATQKIDTVSKSASDVVDLVRSDAMLKYTAVVVLLGLAQLYLRQRKSLVETPIVAIILGGCLRYITLEPKAGSPARRPKAVREADCKAAREMAIHAKATWDAEPDPYDDKFWQLDKAEEDEDASPLADLAQW